MSYKRADEILPEEVLKLIQKYIDGEFIYIPRVQGLRKEWGSGTSIKFELAKRNEKIYLEYTDGCTVTKLAEKYFLSEKSIQRIIRNFKK